MLARPYTAAATPIAATSISTGTLALSMTYSMPTGASQPPIA